MIGARRIIDGLGLAPAYQALWWRARAGARLAPTAWELRRRALFIHVPKTAGLSLYAALDMPRRREGHAPLSAWRRAAPDFVASAYSFAVVRNPWDRAVSAFHYLKHDSVWTEDRVWADRALADIPDFNSFLRALERPWMRNRILAWRHFLPQAYWVAGGGGRVTRLVSFERLDEEMEEVAAAIGAAYLPRRLNSSRRADYRGYYDDRGAELIGRLYAADVSLTGAAFDDGRRLGVTAPPRAQVMTRLA